MNLTKTDWPLGYTPSADEVNGDPRGLLRMDNLTLDEQGVITLVRGIQELTGSLPDYVYKFFSKVIGQTEYIWAALSVSGSSVVRTKDLFSSFTEVISAGGDKACFGDCLGNVLISCGSVRIKDDGTTVNNLGIQTPTKFPVINEINQQGLDCDTPGTWAAVTGTGFEALDPSALIFVDPTQLIGVMTDTYSGDFDTVNFGVTSLDRNGDPGNDLFTMLFQPGDTNDFIKFRVEFCLDQDFSYNNYFWYEFTVAATGTATASADGVTPGTSFLLGIDVQTTVSIYRNQFNRQGNDGTRDWTTVTQFRVTGYATAVNKFVAGQQTFTGGVQGSLNADYQYCAINIADNGTYVAKSGASPLSDVITIYNGYASVQLPPCTDPQVTQTWLFRISASTSRNTNSNTDGLVQFYRVGVGTPGSTIQDNTTDEVALEDDVTLNAFLQSILDVPNTIIGMAGLYNTRMLYLTNDQILLSDTLNPDAIDQRYTVKAFGDPTERNLWLRAVTNNTLVLATTKDLYYLSGTLLSNPDGTLDITIQAIGEAYPPLSEDFAFSDGNIFYVGADGVRSTNGSNSQKLSPTLNLLFQNFTRFGVPPVSIDTNNIELYAIAVGRSRLYVSLPMTDGTRRLFVYDFVQGIWYLRYTDPVTVYCTAKDEVLLGYNISETAATEGGVFLADVGNGIVTSGGSELQGIPFTFQTVFDANGQSRNRKDTFTLKLVADTGGNDVTVAIATDRGTYFTLGVINSNGQATHYFQLSAVTLGFRYSLMLTDKNWVFTFKLYEYTIEYDPRPEQLNYKRILPDNQGSLARKRWITYAFIIDTLGNDVQFTPFIDNVAGSPVTVNTPTKLTFIYYFQVETLGTDVGGILQSGDSQGPFEFYQLNPEETVSEKLPPPALYLVIPANNYGSPNRKRFTSYKFQINTRGSLCSFTPRIDTSNWPPLDFFTIEKQTVEYFFPQNNDVTGIDIGGIIQSLGGIPFEFYGEIVPQQVETLPPRLMSLYTPFTNFGSASRKRIRTIPLVINTNGNPVYYTPIIDNTYYPSQVFTTTYKQTVYYFFSSDAFGIDVGGQLIGTVGPFEFYEFGDPENVEVLPVPKTFDQFQPLRFDKIGKLFTIRVRLIMTGSTTELPLSIYADLSSTLQINSAPIFTTNVAVVPNLDNVYEIQLPKNINGTIMRITLGPTVDPYHRYDLQVRVSTSGMSSDSEWRSLR